MKKLLLISALALSSAFAYTQDNWCGTMENLGELNKNNPNFQMELNQHLDELDRLYPRDVVMSKKSDAQIILPTVVHVLHDNGKGNISYEQIQNGLDLLNTDLRRLNADTADARDIFRAVGADLDIEFRLATLDPDGNCTNGVVRKNAANNSASITYDATDNAKRTSAGGSDAWPTDSYFNIWLVNTVRNGNSEGVVLGYAEFPFSGMGATYGIIMRQDNWGVIGTAAGSNLGGPRTITHEVGHCLNLFHTFQGGCGNTSCSGSGDRVCDTPPTAEATYGCVKSQNLCTNVPGDDFYGEDVNDQIENYMSYDNCTNLFTEGQKERVWQAVQAYPNFANLASAENQIKTGVEDPQLELCKADFTVNKEPLFCVGNTINFTDVSFHNVTSVNWVFEGGTPATSTDSEVEVTYTVPGTYNVSLTVSDGNNTITETYQDFVTVVEGDHFVAPFSENFTEVDAIGTYEFDNSNPGQDVNFELSTSVGNGDSKCVFLENRLIPADRELNFIIKNIETTGLEELDLYFDYAYAPRSSSSSDVLRIYVSNDCGENWGLRSQFKGAKLETANATNVNFQPSASEWKTSSNISLDNYLGGSIQVRFHWTSGSGNNFYLDNINFDTPSGINEFTLNSLNVFPNPAKDQVNIELPVSGNYEFNLVSLDGKLVNKTVGSGSKGEQVNYDLSNFASGLYFITYISQGKEITKKIIIE